ncbi:MAG: carboxypeptidase-like regulatory domain-containing protein [Planctomycetia bacterium]|nr:carboxypeptidase-like regulatory domain-containing protein [Planctomycetia bacterium]
MKLSVYKNIRRCAILAALILLLPLAGCSSEKSVNWEHRTVRGVVTLDGSPVPDATVMFSFPEGAVAGKTDNSGAYEVKDVFLGDVLVTISCVKDTGKVDSNPVTGSRPIMENILPAKYGYGQGIKMSITPDDEPVNLELTSK